MRNVPTLKSSLRKMFKVKITKSAKKEFKKIDKKDQKVISIKILALKSSFTGIKKLKGFSNTFRIRAGSFRIVFEMLSEEKILKITYIRKRNEKTFKNIKS